MSAPSTSPPDPRPTAYPVAEERSLRQGERALMAVLHDLEADRDRAAEAQRAIVRSLAAALEARDGYTGGHSEAVHQLALSVARRLGLSRDAVEHVASVSLLHDIGKIGIPDAILHKPGPLDAGERAIMREHPAIGERILLPLPGMEEVARAVRHEHERWDGRGYPDGLAGEAIPLAARIVLACDTYAAMVSDRPYRRSLPEVVAREELALAAGRQLDPAVVATLLDCLDHPDAAPAGPAPARGEGRTEAELRALMAVATAVTAAHRLEDVVETAADAALEALGVSSLSISRWERDHGELRTLINVGDLGEGEERHPADEVYRTAGFPDLDELVHRRRPHRASVADPEADPDEVALLRSLGKAESLAVPIVYGEDVWGELYATQAEGRPGFDDRDLRFLQAIADQIAAAVGRAEVFGRLAELAYSDPLTGLANRRAFEERLEQAAAGADASGRDVALIVGDLDDLKAINDTGGHAAGDTALVAAAGALARAAERHPGAFVARLSGDEFAIVLPRCEPWRAEELAQRALEVIAPETMSFGVATLRTGAGTSADLLRSADAALYDAKRRGRGQVVTAGAPAPGPRSPERRGPRGRRDTDARLATLLREGLEALDGAGAGAGALERLDAVLTAAAGVLDAPGWAISFLPEGAGHIETIRDVDLAHGRQETVQFHQERYALADYPRTAAIAAGGGFALHREKVPGHDPESRLLAELGYEAVAAIVVPVAGGQWLAELFGDARTSELRPALPALRLLAQAAAGAG